MANLVVLKFGSSVLRSEKDLPAAVHEIYRHWREGTKVIAVVSAFGDTTDQLLRRAENICKDPEKSALATLLATGEAASSALLSLSLTRSGIPARVLDAVQAGIRTAGGRLEADPIAVDAARLSSEARRAVVVLPGFVGRGDSGDTTLLGRGGSDYSALFLAQKLGAQCVLLKDVDGLYTSDPAGVAGKVPRFSHASYETAIKIGGAVVQQKAVRFASAHNLRFSITSIGASCATEIGPGKDELDRSIGSTEPLRVALLGCGTVGSGVYQRLTSLPEHFQVVGVGVRTGERARAVGVPEHLLTSKLEALVEKPCDVVVELIGGTKRASSLTESALRLGRDVVSGNKALLAFKIHDLEELAIESNAALRYSAAVGGAMPALETIKTANKKGRIHSFSGVLNGTCNLILDRLALGENLTTAVRVAQEEGFAEADPKFDLNGIDAAQKLVLLIRAAFDLRVPLESVHRKGIEGLGLQDIKRAQQRGQTLKLIVHSSRSPKGADASVRPVELPPDHPLAQVRGIENRLLVEMESGERLTAFGKGAGCWPTTEAVMADLFDLRRSRPITALEELEECVA